MCRGAGAGPPSLGVLVGMTIRHARRTGAVGLAVAALVLLGVSPAQAIPEHGYATGSIGSVDATYHGSPVQVDPLAACDSEGPAQASSPTNEVSGFYEFGPGESTCTLDSGTGDASAESHGDLFRLDALRPYGGPRIRMTDYTSTCQTTDNGSSASWQVGGLSGISVPPQIPPNYVVTVPGRTSGAPPMATVTLNESIQPDPPDGSLTVNIMHIRLYPQGAEHGISGEIVIGSVYCSPY